MHADTAAARKGEEIDAGALREYLSARLEGAAAGLSVEQFPGGHSNLTYLLKTPVREYVLRRAPLGPLAPKAHDIAREYRVLEAVSPLFPEAPRVYVLCEDASVVGAAFFVMERRQGLILRQSVPPELAMIPDYQTRVSEAFIDCLARLHGIDPAAHGLLALGKPEGFVERQVRGWTERWERARLDAVPAMEAAAMWLARNLPPTGPPSVVHNDYKLDNLMLRTGAATVGIEAVLDWEMATVGEPLADLGLALCYWSWANAPDLRAAGIPALSSQPGWYTRNRMIERYAAQTGRDVSRIAYYEVLGVFKLAVILQQIYLRYRRGQTTDERFRDFGHRVEALAGLAAKMAEQHG